MPTRNCFASLAVLVLIVCSIVSFAQPTPDLRTPSPPAAPRIHGPKIYGARSGHPFLYRIPCTGLHPITFSAANLPASLHLNAKTGIISGTAPVHAGVYLVQLGASSRRGRDKRTFKIVVGDTIGLTPQMGWNDWYTYYDRITEADVRAAAQAMVDSGMADFGYQYVDIDDAWARKPGSTDPMLGGPTRGPDGNILSNGHFPDMPGLTAAIHSFGLKAGIYSSPGPTTCAGFEGSYQHEDADAHQFAAWGFDLLKYDWCSYGKIAKDKSLAEYQKPYRQMSGIVKSLDRDIVLNICQYGKGDVWTWGREVGGNSWRTTDDLGVAKATSLPGFYSIAFANAEHSAYAGPGAWNDPDYILIGTVGNAFKISDRPRHTSLTSGEQYSYMSMWALMAAPLLFSGQMTTLDDLTRSVLCNAEVIDVDQDALGAQARILRKTPDELVLVKPLEDGSIAVGLFNLSSASRFVSVDWAALNLPGARIVRDLWRQRDLGTETGSYQVQIPAHDVMLVRISAARSHPSDHRVATP